MILIFSLTFVLFIQNAVSEFPPYLVEEDFIRASQLPDADYSNATFIAPHDYADHREYTRNARIGGGWPNAIIHYVLDSHFTEHERAEVAKAFENYQTRTCVRFVPRHNEQAYVHILRDDKTCGLAIVCRTGGEQYAKFGGSCITSGVMTHELGHTLCFGHEQSRSDRDEYLAFGNCAIPGKDDPHNGWSTLGLLYDYVSIQHYEGECYNGCFKPKLPGVTKCGSGGPLGTLDADKVNAYYDCGGCWSYRWRKGDSNEARHEPFHAGGHDIDGNEVYPCRAYHNGDIIPGKGIPGRGCWVSYGGAEHFHADHYEILTNPKKVNLHWETYHDGHIPGNAIRGGRTSQREPLYISRCVLKGKSKDGKDAVIIGKIHPSIHGIYIPVGGKEERCMNGGDILVCS